MDVGTPDNVRVDQYDITLLGRGLISTATWLRGLWSIHSAFWWLHPAICSAWARPLGQTWPAARLCHRMTSALRQANWLLRRQEADPVILRLPGTLRRCCGPATPTPCRAWRWTVRALPHCRCSWPLPICSASHWCGCCPTGSAGASRCLQPCPAARRHIPRRTQVFLDYLTTETRLNMERALVFTGWP